MIINPFVFAAAGGAAYRYWRIYVEANDGDASYTSMSEMELFEGATDRTAGAGGSAVASSQDGSDAPSRTVDDNIDTEWVSASGQAVPSWVAIDLGAAYVLTSYSIRSQRVVTGRTPSQWKLQGNNASTGSGETWVDVDSRSGQTGWAIQEKRTFTL